jgi:hypothetical protein
MVKKGKDNATKRPAADTNGKDSRALHLAKTPIRTGQQFADLMSGLMSDLIEGNIPPGVGNAVCNAGGKLLKVVEMQMKYGRQDADGNKHFVLVHDPESRPEK